jgi:hypothetical protein
MAPKRSRAGSSRPAAQAQKKAARRAPGAPAAARSLTELPAEVLGRLAALAPPLLVASAAIASDPAVALAAVSHHARLYAGLPPKVRRDKAVAMRAVSGAGTLLFYVPRQAHTPNIVRAAVLSDPAALYCYDWRVRLLVPDLPAVLEQAVRRDGQLIFEMPAEYRTRRLLEAAVTSDPTLVADLCGFAEVDAPLFLRAVRLSPGVYELCAERGLLPTLTGRPAVAEEAVRRNGRNFLFVPAGLRSAALARLAVGGHHAPLHPDRHLVMRAFLPFLDPLDVARGAVGLYPYLLAETPHRDHEGVVLQAVQRDGTALRLASERLRDELHLAVAALARIPGEQCSLVVYRALSLRLKRHPEVALALTRRHPALGVQVDRGNPEYPQGLEPAIRAAPLLLGTVPGELRSERLCRLAVEGNPFALVYVPRHLVTKALCLEALQRHSQAYRYMPGALRKDREVALLAVQRDGRNYSLVPRGLKQDLEVVQAAVASEPCAAKQVPVELLARALLVLQA